LLPNDGIDRQYGKLDEIRPDHVYRYVFAASVLKKIRVLDLACGCGYGSFLLHGAGNDVTAADIAPEAIEYAKKNYPGPNYILTSAEEFYGEFDAIVSFETLEHLGDPLSFLNRVKAKKIICSVPNEEVTPFNPEKFEKDTYPHRRHYTPSEFEALLNEAGFNKVAMYSQHHKRDNVHLGSGGMFLIACGERDG